jgi:Transglycosylase SLT domain
MMAVPFVACMALVASIYHLPPRVLPAIHGVEGGWPGAVNVNADGSQDLGVMQVNTRWIPALSRYTGQPESFVRQQLLMHACYNIAASGLILRTYLNETHGDLMRAIGDYHSHTAPLNTAYQAQVMQSALGLFGPKPKDAGQALPTRRVTAAR